MAYDPLQYGVAKANIIGQTVSGISNSVINAVKGIDQIVKQKNAKEKLQLAYTKSIDTFIQQAKEMDPELSDTKARTMAMRAYKDPKVVGDIKMGFENLLKGDDYAQKMLDKLETETKLKKTKGEASAFTQKMSSPIEERRQVQAEGPPVPTRAEEGPPQYPPERIGEIPMETQISQRPVRTSEYEQQYNQLSPEAQKYVPENLKSRVSSTEQTFQQPLKTFEDQRTSQLKERESNIKTMTGIDKDAGYRTAIIESKDTVESLNTKKKSLDELIKTVNKVNNLPPKQVQDKGAALQSDIEDIAAQLNIPNELATNPEFLGRYGAELERLIKKETDQQGAWEISLQEYNRRKDAEEIRKRTPRQPSATPDWKLGKELQTAIKDMTKQQFPDLYKVMEGEYGIDVMKRVSGVAEAARAIVNDPNKRIALAYAFPEEAGSIAKAKGAAKPSYEEIQSVLTEMQRLQDKVYGAIQGAPQSTAPSDDLFGGLGDL